MRFKHEDSPRAVAARRGLKVSMLQARRRGGDAEAAAEAREGRSIMTKTPKIEVTSSRPAARSAVRPSSARRWSGLSLNKIGRRAELTDTPAVRGMIAKVAHLVRSSKHE